MIIWRVVCVCSYLMCLLGEVENICAGTHTQAGLRAVEVENGMRHWKDMLHVET